MSEIAPRRLINRGLRFRSPEYWPYTGSVSGEATGVIPPAPPVTVIYPPTNSGEPVTNVIPPPTVVVPPSPSIPAQITEPTVVVPVYGDLWNASLVAAANRVITAKLAHPNVAIMAIINPANGPGSARISTITNFVNAAKAAGVIVIGYVSTYYMFATNPTPLASPFTGVRYTPDRIKADIAKYKEFYPTLDGIHYDELSTSSSKLNNYIDVCNYARAAGYKILMGNPGTAINTAYYDLMDTFEIYEGSGYPSIATIDTRAYTADKSKFTVIVHSVASYNGTFVTNSTAHAWGIYVTHTDSYGTMSNHLEDTVETLDV